MAINIGDQAPNFTLVGTDTKEVSLDSFNGKPVVLLFFPMAFTGVCTEELCSVRDSIADYNDMNAQVIGISVDSPFTLNKFKEDQNLNFPLLSDFNKTVSRAYDAIYEEFVFGLKGVSKRAVFVLDETGKVIHKEVLDSALNLPDFEKVKESLQSVA